jgi:solute carrier family 8 (sodium/calcium exchanger)
MHFATMGWKVLFSCIPPVKMYGGWAAFFVAICFIGTITAVVAEAATILGCNMFLKESVTAITLVAIGTSLPDTFASRTAALNSEFADSAIGNVTGSNSVNIFVGLGLPWVMATLYSDNGIYEVPEGSLTFSVALFLATSVTCFLILILRRTVSFIFLNFLTIFF